MKYFANFILIFIAFSMNAQKTYEVNFSKGLLYLKNVNGVSVEAYDGQNIIFETNNDVDRDNGCNNCNHKKSDKSKGLRLINGVGESDNTGLGLKVVEEDGVLKVTQIINSFECIDAKIKVPHGVAIKYKNNNVSACDFSALGIRAELEISQSYSDIDLTDVTGPLTIQSIYGDVDIKCGTVYQDGALAINATYGDIDISLPRETPANLLMKTSYGDAYTDFEIDISRNITDEDKTKTRNLKQPEATGIIDKTTEKIIESTFENIATAFGGSTFGSYIKGKINGGGVDMLLKCSYGDIYLRQGK